MSRAKCVCAAMFLLAFLTVMITTGCAAPALDGEQETIKSGLGKPRTGAALSNSACLEELLRQRRSIRSYAATPLRKEEVMKLLWAGQGITSAEGYRTAPSAGALYPLELYLIVGKVDGLTAGIYKYEPAKEALTLVEEGDARISLAEASLGQSSVAEAAIDIVIAGVYERTESKYGPRGERFVHIEVGHAAQNICLEATALGLGLVTIGAFDDSLVAQTVGMAPEESPLYVMPVGRID